MLLTSTIVYGCVWQHTNLEVVTLWRTEQYCCIILFLLSLGTKWVLILVWANRPKTALIVIIEDTYFLVLCSSKTDFLVQFRLSIYREAKLKFTKNKYIEIQMQLSDFSVHQSYLLKHTWKKKKWAFYTLVMFLLYGLLIHRLCKCMSQHEAMRFLLQNPYCCLQDATFVIIMLILRNWQKFYNHLKDISEPKPRAQFLCVLTVQLLFDHLDKHLSICLTQDLISCVIKPQRLKISDTNNKKESYIDMPSVGITPNLNKSSCDWKVLWMSCFRSSAGFDTFYCYKEKTSRKMGQTSLMMFMGTVTGKRGWLDKRLRVKRVVSIRGRRVYSEKLFCSPSDI